MLSASLAILMDDFHYGRNATPLPHHVSSFNWETKIKDLLPDEWMLKDQWQYEKITLRDALSHVSGLIGCVLYILMLCWRQNLTIVATIYLTGRKIQKRTSSKGLVFMIHHLN